jgi:hypothetical protein
MAVSDPWELYDRLQPREVAKLSIVERRLVAVGSLRSEVSNGGFDQYFFNSAGDLASDAVEAARGAGADDLARLIERAIALLDASDLGDRASRHERALELRVCVELATRLGEVRR